MGLFSNLSFRKRGQEPEPASSGLVALAEPVVLPETIIDTAPATEEAVVLEVAAAVVATPAPEPVAVALAPSAAERAQAEELVRRVANELPTFISVAVVEAATGTILAGQWAGHSGGSVEVALANAEIVRQTNLAIKALQLTATEQLADILVTLRHQLHLVRVLPQLGWLLYLAVHTKDTNLALARAIVQSFDE